MRNLLAVSVLALTAGAVSLSAQALTCANSGSDHCAVVHYHTLAWSVANKQTTELYGTNSFASMSSCEAARSADAASNQGAIENLTRLAPRLHASANRYGPCHCDRTMVSSDPHFLDDERRNAQVRTDHELRMQLLDALVDAGVAADSPVIRALFDAPRGFSGAQWPRTVPLPELSKQKLLDPEHSVLRDSSISLTSTSGPAPSTAELVEAHFDPALSGPVEAVSAPENHFVEAEMSRMTALLQEVSALPDSPEKEKLLESCNRRILLLTNLSRMIESAGARSLLAGKTSRAGSDEARLAVIGQIFGSQVSSHWKVSSAADAAVDAADALPSDPVGMLRDSTGRYDKAQRQYALYVFLSRNPNLTESQELWLAGIIENLLGAGV